MVSVISTPAEPEPQSSSLADAQPSPELLLSGSIADAQPSPELVLSGYSTLKAAAAGGAAAHLCLPVAAAGIGYSYGKKLATDPKTDLDPVGLKPRFEAFSQCMDSLIAWGYLKLSASGSLECLGVSRSTSPRMVLPTVCGSEDTLIRYKTTTVGSKVHIGKEDMPAFLLDNGIPLMDPSQLEKHLQTKLSETLPVSSCKLVGQCSIDGKVVAASLGTSDPLQGLKPGEARYKIRITDDFSNYTKDTNAYENMLKDRVLEALGLDPAKIPGAKKQVKVEKVEEGSIIARLIISGVLLVAGAVSGYYHSRDSKSKTITGELRVQVPPPTTPPAAASAEASPTARRLLSHMTLRSVGDDDDDWELVGQLLPTQRCYLPDTLFRMFRPVTSQGGFKTAMELAEGDKVVGLNGSQIELMNKEVCEPKLRQLRTLRTAQAEITVTSSHRIYVIEKDLPTEQLASKVKIGDVVVCGDRHQKLTKVIDSQRDIKVVELAFFPDDPVETFQAPQWSILTFGRPHHARVGSYGPLGPRNVGEPQDPAESSERTRSASI